METRGIDDAVVEIEIVYAGLGLNPAPTEFLAYFAGGKTRPFYLLCPVNLLFQEVQAGGQK